MKLALLCIGALFAIGCSASDDPRVAGAPIDFDPPPIEETPPPANTATASTNTSNFLVAPLDSADCALPTTGVFEFYQASSNVHFQTLDFNEGVSNSYSYEFPFNLLVNEIPGKTVPFYRCLSGSAGHFVSFDAKCEGAVNEGLFGHAYSRDLPQPAGTTPLFRLRSTSGDHIVRTSPIRPDSHWTLEQLLGYTPTKACKALSTTCQPFPSWYSGYSVNPGPDSDTGELIAYGSSAPAPPWFGNYQGAGDAILPGDWGTYNNVDWAKHFQKAECGYTDWMTGLSSSPSDGGALHAFRCAMSEFSLPGRLFNGSPASGFNCNYPNGDELSAPGDSGNRFRNRQRDWDYGYYKHSCGADQYLAGVASDGHNGRYQDLMCCSQSGIGGDDCTTVVVGAASPEQNTSMTTDDNGNVSALDWDPPSFGKGYPKGECGAGRRMMGVSVDKNKALHAILCCRTPTPAPVQASTSCCSPQTLQTAVANCNADHLTFQSDCDNVVAPCCNSDPNSDGAGGLVCAKEAAALDPNASNKDGDPDSLAMGATANAGPTCGSSGAALAWSYAYNKGQNVGNKTFGAGYAGQVTFGAGPIYANGEASVSAHASLFGTKVEIALVDLKGSITADNPLSAEIKAVGKDLYVYPSHDKKQNNSAGSPPPTTPTNTGTDWTWPKSSNPGKFDSNTLTYTVPFFTEKEVIFLFGVPVTITGSITGQLGIIATVDSAGDTLTFNATPWVGATATCVAALGGGKGAFKLTAGVEGSLNLFTASLPTVATISPYTNHVNYTLNSDFTLAALDGKIDAFLKVKLKPLFRKTFKTTLTKWKGPTTTLHLFHHNGCVSY